MSNLQALMRMLIVIVFLVTCTLPLKAQSLPEVPFDITFAEVSVHLTEPGRVQIQQEIYRLYTNRTTIQRTIDALRQLTPILQPVLREAGLPDDFRYAALPFADSEPNTFWSISRTLAKDLNLRVNATVDERYHPVLATAVVAPYLNKLQQSNGNYVQTLLQYIRISTNSPESQPVGFNSTYTLLDPASPSLIWKILARKLVIEREEPTHRPVASYILYGYQNSGGQTMQSIAQKLHISDERMKPFNEWLHTNTVPVDKEYSVLIRVTADEYPIIKRADESGWKMTLVYQADVGFPMLTKQQNDESGLRSSAVFYTINNRRGVQAQSCDNAITLAFYGHIDVRSLLQYNELGESDVIRPGGIYYLEAKEKRAKVPFHVVQRSQTLREVSNIYGVRLKSLLMFNRLEPTQRVQAGRILWLQKKRPRSRSVEYQQLPVEPAKPVETPVSLETPSQPGPLDSLASRIDSAATSLPQKIPVLPNTTPATVAKTDSVKKLLPVAVTPSKPLVNELKAKQKRHVVKAGQTYYSVSQLYRISVKQLYAWNKVSEQMPLKVGQVLLVSTPGLPTSLLAKPDVGAKPVATNKPPWINSFVVEPTQKAFYYVVQAGQTVYRVALINKVSVADIMRWNKLTTYTIEIGQKILIIKRK